MPANDPSPNAGNEGTQKAPDESRSDAKAEHEKNLDTVSKPGGFKNDPDEATDPNEAIERHRQKLRR